VRNKYLVWIFIGAVSILLVFVFILYVFIRSYYIRQINYFIWIRDFSGFDISNDGGRMVFIPSTDEQSSKLCVMDLKSGKTETIKHDGMTVRNPCFISNRGDILYEARKSGDPKSPWHLYMVSVHSRKPHKLLSGDKISWRILCTAPKIQAALVGSTSRLIRQDFAWYWDWDVETRHLFYIDSKQVSPPVGNLEACSSDGTVWVRRNGRNIEIVRGTFDFSIKNLEIIGNIQADKAFSFCISPDKRRVAFISVENYSQFINIFDIENKTINKIPYTQGYYVALRFHPDGKHLLVSGTVDAKLRTGIWQIPIEIKNTDQINSLFILDF